MKENQKSLPRRQAGKIKNQNLLLVSILFLAAILRLYQLGNNPPALDWDEASLGYNAYSILKTGKDEFGRSWPISIRSFEDYKPAMYTYLTIPTIYIFGLNEFAVRLPSAFLGTLTVFAAYLLVGELLKKSRWEKQCEILALLTSALLAISPWHLQFSRVAFESNVSLFFVIFGMWAYLKGLKTGGWLSIAALLLGLSFYSYHSPRLVVPLILLGWSWLYRRQLLVQKRWVAVSAIIGFFIIVPFLLETFGAGGARLSSVTVLKPEGRVETEIERIEYDRAHGDLFGALLHNRRVVYAKAVIKGYLDHFNLDFLFLQGDAPGRHHAQDVGMLYIWEAPFILLGLLFALKTRELQPLLWWFLVAPAASAITTGTPHAVRALLYLPTYQLFTAIGISQIVSLARKHLSQQLFRGLVLVLGFIILGNFFYYLEMYYVHTPVEVSQDWQYGYKQAVPIIKQYESQVSRVVMTYAYDQPHVFLLFYLPVDPAWYQRQWSGGEVLREQRGFAKYEFRRIKWAEDQYKTDTLFIGTPEEIPDTAGEVAHVTFLDGSIALRIVKR